MPRPVTHLANLDLNLLVALRELVRDRGEYTLTALGAQLAEQVDAVCTAAERLFAASADFDPASSEREFTLVMAD